jgi:hypothetical protein
VLTTQNKFYCNIKALNPAEHEHYKQLTDKLIAARREIVETERVTNSSTALQTCRLPSWLAGWRQKASAAPFLIFILTSSARATCSVFG